MRQSTSATRKVIVLVSSKLDILEGQMRNTAVRPPPGELHRQRSPAGTVHEAAGSGGEGRGVKEGDEANGALWCSAAGEKAVWHLAFYGSWF